VLDGVELAVAAGEMVALLGRSGCGKTTVLNLVGALDRADEGSVEVAGEELGRLREGRRCRVRSEVVGFVFQEPRLLDHLSCRANVALAAAFERRQRRGAADRAVELLEKVGLGWAGEVPTRELSGGERQRLGLARALFHRPQVLLCDEVTAQLDADTGAVVVGLIAALRTSEGLTVLAATHDERLAAACDRRVRLASGRIGPATEGS